MWFRQSAPLHIRICPFLCLSLVTVFTWCIPLLWKTKLMIIMVLIWEQFIKFNVLDDIYAAFFWFILPHCFVFYIQVHRAVLHNGERVAVKVQRPGPKTLQFSLLRSLSRSFGDIYIWWYIQMVIRTNYRGWEWWGPIMWSRIRADTAVFSHTSSWLLLLEPCRAVCSCYCWCLPL